VIGQRAQDGARKLYQIITDKKSDNKNTDTKNTDSKTDGKKAPDHTGSIGGGESADASQAPRDTLTPDDLVAEWRSAPLP
jgi:hypothetical protein